MATHTHQSKRVLILGAGYAGIRTALDLADQEIPGLKVTLIGNRPHFEYTPTLYRLVAGYSALQVCIPMSTILKGHDVEFIEDQITRVDLEHRQLFGGIESPYEYDYLVLAVGAETSYFNIPGLSDLSYGFKSIHEALRLRQHVHEMLMPPDPTAAAEQKVIAGHFIVVGGGPTGVELASELIGYGKKVAAMQGGDPTLVTVDLIEAAPRVLPAMPADISAKVEARLHSLGVNVFTNRTVTKEEVDQLTLKESSVRTKTVIWTAGVKTNRLIAQIPGLELDKRGRIVVDDYLRAKGHADVYALGDIASTKYGGTAQTANSDGTYLARVIGEAASGKKKHQKYAPHTPIYAIPVGPNWAVVLWGGTRIYGRLGSWLRRAADLRYFMGILPFGAAFKAFSRHDVVSEECPACAP